jgi:carbonic anhydrase
MSSRSRTPVGPTVPSGRTAGERLPRPAEALAELLNGNRRFISGQPLHGHDVAAAAATAGDQQPYAVVIGCIDSRVPLEAIFDQTFGSICVVRSGAHVLDRAVLGSVTFAVTELCVPLVVVLGHERCGAVASTIAALRGNVRPDGPAAYLVDQISPAVTEVGLDEPDLHALATRRHIARTVAALHAEPQLDGFIRSGRVEIVGAVYDLASGEVNLLR